MKAQFELPQAEVAFNLASEVAEDPWRVERDRIAAIERHRDVQEYQKRMQLTLERCPGLVSADVPATESDHGFVVVEPGRLIEAATWLKRRFHVNENLELSQGDGVVFEIAPRIRRVTRGRTRRKVSFGPAMQYELALA